MTALDDAQAHLVKAREFLEAARLDLTWNHVNAATSNAVISGINSKDAICLRLTGTTRKRDNHHDAVAELKAAGPAGAALASTLGRLLKLKTKAQYQSRLAAPGDAAKAIEWAGRLLDEAETVVTGR
ncbi:hypothetical protein NPS01_40250 [Nocardioides psychrotolerans]|uniref:HEPN domain-containing protein n=1 Tax=Nocardioides psychrotolerans TaxID=1005945 RepID=A0A1I3IUK5_9ACTN|nr:HEPN domain-containing protein [Nocardioides psychrotolerans]GEP40362.1 hypothetical protein NPS01_40250 [Nocardioides psychrotolerans]SFI51622.1 HEPN domain-containing protein [Nocardioides psychrotolerans]